MVTPKASRIQACIFGDSLTQAAENSFRTLVKPRYTFNYGSYPGSSVENFKPAILEATEKSLVLAFGTNDAVVDPDASEWRLILETLLPSRRLAWLKTYEATPEIAAFNVQMELLRRDHTNLKTVDWNAVAKLHPEWHLADGVHHTARGNLEYAKMLNMAAQKCL